MVSCSLFLAFSIVRPLEPLTVVSRAQALCVSWRESSLIPLPREIVSTHVMELALAVRCACQQTSPTQHVKCLQASVHVRYIW